MKVINRYILKDFISYSITCLAVLVFIYVVINLFDNLGKYLAKNVSLMDIMIYYLYLTPSYIVLLIPIAVIMGVFLVFGVMTKNRELIALKTSGLNINHLFSLIFKIGIIIAICTFVFQETIGVWAQTRMYEHRLAKIEKRPRRPPSLQRNFFYYGENNWVYFIKKFDGTTNIMNDIVLWEITKDNRVKKRIDAKRGKYEKFWIFEQATAREFDTLGGENIKEYAVLNMSELKEKPQDIIKRVKPLEEMNFLEICKFVRKRSRAGDYVAKENVELNYRFSYPIITLIVLLIALPLSVVLKRGGIAIGLGISIVIAFTYWGMIQSCRAYGVADLMDPLVAAWLPNFVFGAIGLILMLRVRR